MRVLTLTAFCVIFSALSLAQTTKPTPDAAMIAEQNKKIEAENAAIQKAITDGTLAYREKRYSDAIVSFDKGLAISPENSAVFTLNKSLALNARAVDRYNTAVHAKDAVARDSGIAAAKRDWTAAAAAINEAYLSAKDPNGNGQRSLPGILKQRAEILRFVLTKIDMTQSDTVIAAYREYLAIEADRAERSQAQLRLGNALAQIGENAKALREFEALMLDSPLNYEAMFGAASSLLALQERKNYQRSADLFKRYLHFAPATDERRSEAQTWLNFLKDEGIVPKP